MGRVIIIIISLFLKLYKCSLEYCQPIDSVSCNKLQQEYEVPEECDKYAFQTPPRNDALGHYLSTFQDMSYIVGWIEYNYNEAKTQCNVTFNVKVNPNLGTENQDYYIYYSFGDFEEQEKNQINLNSIDDSYPNGLSPSCRVVNKRTGNEVANLQLQNIYFIWDNIEVNTPIEYKNGQRGAIVELFGWSMEDVGEECEFLGIAGYLGVKIFSPYESLLSDTMTEGETLNPWWYGTQVVSFKYNCRTGNENQFKKIINRCRAVNVRVYAEIVINHMTGDGYDMNPNHYNGQPPCNSWGPREGSGGSPFYTAAFQIQYNYYTHQPPGNEYPAVPYFPSDFHCGEGVSDWGNPFQLCYRAISGLQDINTEKEYPRRRIATYIVDLLSLGISGVMITNGGNIPNFSFAKIFRYTKKYLGNKLPPDFFAVIIIAGLNIYTEMCNEEGYLDFGTTFTNLLKEEGFDDNEILQIKLWFKGCLSYETPLTWYDISCGHDTDDTLLINVERWTISLEYSDDINKAHDDYNIYIKHKNVEEHKNILINNMFLKPRFNHTIKFVFTSFSVDTVYGIPDGKSEKSFCASDDCLQYTIDLPFKRAFNPFSTGYDCGDGEGNWINGEYSRIHRDKDIINAMREWMFNTNEKSLTDEELYTKDKLKADCDQKCLICNEESKLLNKCIFCDSDNDYYPVMNIGGSEEYYECHLRTEKVENLYFSNREKAFLPCYETCKYCDELGDIKDQKCTKCDYNFIKDPATKDTATSFNCLVKCSYSYYYTISGQYKCSNSPLCPLDSTFYVQERKKCVSSCNGEDPYKYLYNGNCVEECPSDNYYPDEVDNICKLNQTEQCTLESKAETFNTLYSSNLLDLIAKRYHDEYTYTNKMFIKINNPNYNIIIFKDFDCIEELGLDIPDIRYSTNRRLEENDPGGNKTQNKTESLPEEDTCYIKIQKYFGTEDQLIVVYIEDISNLITERGYLLYSPYTGAKTNFESICGDKVIGEKEDITADANYEHNLLKYIYIKPISKIVDLSGPTSCKDGKAPVYKNNVIDYSICLDKGIQNIGYYYDSLYDLFMPCHENCKYCNRGGSISENYCMECADGYIKLPVDGRKENYNCVIECAYSYYFNSDGIYSCSQGPTCPKAYGYYISSKNQCIDECKNDDEYVNTYNGNCLIECPTGFIPDENGICIVENVDLNKCSWTKKEITLRNFDENGGLDTLVRNYYKEFYYTGRHVSEFNNSEYDIIIYIQKSCLSELNLNFPEIDFGKCYSKVQNETGLLNQSLIVVLLKKIDIKTGRTSSSYSLYNPKDGSKLDAATICKDEEIVVEKSVLEILEESGINYEYMVFLTDQNIDIFNSSGEFYTDICFEFDSPIERDITLADRLETFFPNVSLCDVGCESKGVNLNTMKAICSCSFNDISNTAIVSYIEYLNEVFEIISSSNIQVLKCMKYMFKRFVTSIGGFLMICCIILVAIFGLIFYYRDLDILKEYIVNKTGNYIDYLNKMLPEEDKKSSLIIIKVDEKSNEKKEKNKNKQNNNVVDFKVQRKKTIEDIILLNKINGSSEVFVNNKIKYRLNSKKKRRSINNQLKENKVENKKEEEDFEEYLAPDIDDQEFEDIYLQDKRTFKEYFIESLNDKQIFLNTFKIKDNFLPTSLKIIVLILTLVLYIVINGFFYGEDSISEIYHIEGEDSFFGFFPRSITRYIYCAVVSTIVGVIIDLFFVSEKSMKRIFVRQKDNIPNLKADISELSKEIILRYIIFIFFVIVVFILLMFYLLCFNYVYQYTQKDWAKSSALLIIIMQILSVLFCLLETSLRFLGFYLKSEKIFKLSKLLD